ncbi:MAG: GTPase HflX [Candidatus Thorarchaeota archaeon]|nr:MAG: GTPase HflX [Candidatus Thorarchaeota archaeon]
MHEFESLAETAGYMVVGRFDIVGVPSAKYGIRAGKAEEIGTWIEINQPEYALFSPALKSSQLFRLMEKWEIEVRDRTQVILEIFDKHAGTPQAKLQIEQARLRYELPFERHQIRMRLQKEHTGDRPIAEQIGAGEDPLTLRISEIKRRVAQISAKLKKISEEQTLKKKKRKRVGFSEIALAGYTNAGKSTLHRALTGSDVAVEDKFFTTLATKSSSLSMVGRQVVLTDSVGFISDLPPALLEAFNTTLMEITSADVIILVVDGSNSLEEMGRKIEVCQQTFNRVGVGGIPLVLAINKTDLLDENSIEERLVAFEDFNGSVVAISAKESTGLEALLAAVERSLPGLVRYSIDIPYDRSAMSVVSWLHDNAHVLSQSFDESVIHVEVYLSEEALDRLAGQLPLDALTRVMDP